MVETLADAKNKRITIREFSDAVNIPTRTLYFWRQNRDSPPVKRGRKTSPPNSLLPPEKRAIVDVLLKPEWVDLSPREIYYKLLDEEQKILASISTFYRVAGEHSLSSRRGAEPSGKKLNRETPHLMAIKPNEIWSWDVTQIPSSIRTSRYYLYVILDIWSRYVVGWTLEDHEKSDHAIKMWKTALEDQALSGKGLINHKDNGAIMTAHEMIRFIKDAEMIDSYSRAGVSDDNPFSESLFRTIKYFRNFPESIANIEVGRTYFGSYFQDYNYEHRHSGIQFISPASRHYGEEEKILNIRNKTIATFHATNPHRYSSKSKLFTPIKEVKIN